ncbi:hypothetical protein GCM10022381_33600 [Leifsonia kafniensis]|uniref:Uncharacterized protein n=1 Tax=Leifsonia kafniensis TaxID=475957 RepID=A0ABP7KYM8_9MICO
MIVIASFSRRILGTRIGIIRLLIAGILGLAAEVGFESQFVWDVQEYTPAEMNASNRLVHFGVHWRMPADRS